MKSIYKGDYGYELSFTIQDSSGTRLDLTSGTILFKAGIVNSGSTTFSGLCVPDIAISGTCHYTLTSGLTNTIGVYDAQLNISYPTKNNTVS